jgi:hypothetical protein
MPDYVFKSRDGQTERVYSEKELTQDQLEELSYQLFEDISMTPGDTLRSQRANVSDMKYSMGEALVDFSALGRGSEGPPLVYTTPQARQVIAELEPEYREAAKIAELERQADLNKISDSLNQARREAREEITAPTPQRVQEDFAYQVVDTIGQIGTQLAAAGLGGLAAGPVGAGAVFAGSTIPLGYTTGKDDYYRSIDKTPSTATPEERDTAEAVGAINGIKTYALEKIGMKGIQKVFLKNRELNKKLFKLAQEGKLTKDSFKEITKDVGKAALGEGFTEAADEAGLNILANSLFGYDPERETLEGTGRAFALGSIGGGAFGAAGASPRIARESAAVPLKAITKATKAVSGVSKSLAKGTLKAKDMVKNAPITAKILDGLMKNGIDVSKITESISKKVVPVTKGLINSIKDSSFFKKSTPVVEDIITPITSRIRSINKNAFIALNSYKSENQNKQADYLKKIVPYLSKINDIEKSNPEDYGLIYNAFHKTNNRNLLKPLHEKYEIEKEFDEYLKALEDLRSEALTSGVLVGEIEDFLPRNMKDYDGFRKHLGLQGNDDIVEKALKKMAESDEDYSIDKVGEFFERIIIEDLKNSGNPKHKGIGTNPLKKRVIDNVSDDAVKFYHTPQNASVYYVNRMVKSIVDSNLLRDFNSVDRSEFKDIEQRETQAEEVQDRIVVQSINDEKSPKGMGPTPVDQGDATTRTRDKVSSDELPYVLGSTFEVKGIPLKFESNVDKALYAYNKFKDSRKDQSLRTYLRRQLDLEEGKKSAREILSKSKEVVSAVGKAERKFKKKGGVPDHLSKSLGSGRMVKVLRDELLEGRLDQRGYDEIVRLLRGAFKSNANFVSESSAAYGRKDFANFSRGVKSFTTLAFMSNPMSTVTQLGDFAYNLFENKQAAFQQDKDISFTLEDLNLAGQSVGFEFTSDGSIPDKLQKAIDTVFTLTGFRKLDEKMKEKFINSTYVRVKSELGKSANERSAKVFDEISDLMGPENAQKVVNDIRAGRKTDLVSEFLFYKLSEIAPLSKLDMSYTYLTKPNIRMAFALKSYTMKQLDYARRNVFKKIFSGNEDEVQEGLQNLFQMLISLMIANAPVEFIHAFLKEGSLPNLSDLTTENLWRVFGLNSYTGMVAEREGVGSATVGMLIPPAVSLVDAASKDIAGFNFPGTEESKTTQFIPIIGKNLSWAMKQSEED